MKILCKAKEELENLDKEQNQQLKRLIAEKDQYTQTILCVKSKNNELEQQMTSLKRVNLELETTIHSLEKSEENKLNTNSNTSNTSNKIKIQAKR